MKDDLVNTDSVLPSHQVVYNLKHRPIKGGCVVQPSLNPATNAMYVSKGSTGFEPPILFRTASPMTVM